jgi:hypothetical protein
MILPQLRLADGCHRCHNSGGSHIAMQGIQKPGFGYQVPPAQKESTLGVSRKMMHGCAAGTYGAQNKSRRRRG